MKKSILVLAVALAATPAFADKKLDDAIAKAESQLEKKPDDALRNFTKFADGNPSPEAYVYLARLQLRIATPEDAAQSAAKAVELSASAAGPAKAEALASLSGLDLLRGSSKDALAHAQEAVKADPSNVAAQAALARAQARAQDGVTALATAEKAVQAGATSGIAHVARGEALLALGRAKDAEAAFRKALEVDPRLVLARTRLAEALIAAGRAAEAEAEAKKATEADPKSAMAFAVLGQAVVAVDPKRWDEAIAHAQQGAFLNARDAAVQTIVGQIFEAGSNLDQAQLSYKRALEADPGFVPARVALVQASARKGQTDVALAEAQKLVQDTPNSGPAHLQLGRLFLRKGDWAGAAAALEKAAALLPASAEAHARLGTAYQYTGKRSEALAAYKKAVELEAANIDYRTTYGLLLGVSDQDEAGVAELKKVIESPGYKQADAFINIAWIYRNMKPPRAQESVDAYKRGLEIDPKSEQAAIGMAWSYSYLKKWDEAIAAFQKAIELDPTLAGDANAGIAWAHVFKKDVPKAKEFADKAKASGRDDTRLRSNIDRVEKGLAAEDAPEVPKAPPAPKIERADAGTLSDQLMRGSSPAARRRAAIELGSHGSDGVPALIHALNDADFGVAETAARTLGNLGPRASASLAHLRAILPQPLRTEKTVMTPAEMQEHLREQAFRGAVRDAVIKIGGR